jgi:hypothetical protein
MATQEEVLERHHDNVSVQEPERQDPSGRAGNGTAHVEAHGDSRRDAATLVRGLTNASMAEMNEVMSNLQEIRSVIQREGERIEREIIAYAQITHKASIATRACNKAIDQMYSGHAATNDATADR